MDDTKWNIAARCFICGNEAKTCVDPIAPFRKCPRCGTYEYYPANLGFSVPGSHDPSFRVRLAGWIREQNDSGVELPNITSDVMRRVSAMRLPKLQERADRALLVIAKFYPSLSGWYDPKGIASYPELQGRSYSADDEEGLILIHILTKQHYLRDGQHMGVGLSVEGLLAAEALGSGTPQSAQGFVAMSFDESLNDVWTSGFAPAIRAAGFLPFRIDGKEYVGGISDEIIAEIRRSRFLIVDYTGQKNGVYFEAGFALGMGLVVIPTCQKNEVSKLHFDIKHLNTLLWAEPTDLVEALSKRIMAVIGAGPNFTEIR